MIRIIDEALAFQVVNTVKDVCGQDINFINKSGIIFASTNPKRIGVFHEIGHKAALTGTMIEVSSDDSFDGTKKGINLPVYHNHELLAVIGISGEPDLVRKYAHLAERITNLLIRERELGMTSRNQADKKHFVIDSLIRKTNINMNYLHSCLQEFHIDSKTDKRLILIKADTRNQPVNQSLLEQKINHIFQMLSLSLYTFYYPNEYLAVIDAEMFEKNAYMLNRFAVDHQNVLKIAVGKSCSIYQLADSHASALTTLKHISVNTEGFLLFDDLTLEIIFSGLNETEKEEFLSKTISSLSEDDLRLVQAYFDENMSLANTGRRLFLHKNTLQYKLNHIYRKCGLNPRCFKDAVLLYLAVKLVPEERNTQ
ncbi:MAG: sugar diacid utilization regulator SdaR [Lachnospiraceae bacterium]|nr:sugar diacid utilization regulator SdaR [Lachnospiraceae bacterium]